MNSVREAVAMRIAGVARDNAHRWNRYPESKSLENPDNPVTCRTLITVIKDADARSTRHGPHVLDGSFVAVFFRVIGFGSGFEADHSGLLPPFIGEFDFQSMMLQFHKAQTSVSLRRYFLIRVRLHVVHGLYNICICDLNLRGYSLNRHEA